MISQFYLDIFVPVVPLLIDLILYVPNAHYYDSYLNLMLQLNLKQTPS